MSTIAIMQPTFIPWLGYFELIDKVDKFVFLDDVQLVKRSWQTRNFFISNKKCFWSTIPIKGSSRDQICNAKIDSYDFFLGKFVRLMQHHFLSSELKQIIKLLNQKINQKEIVYLAEFNIAITEILIGYFGIDTKLYKSSEMNQSIDKNLRIINIVKDLNCTKFIAAPGSRGYMNEFGLEKYPFELSFFEYEKAKKICTFYDGFGYENVFISINRLGIEKIKDLIFN